jgi:hypothetical protein
MKRIGLECRYWQTYFRNRTSYEADFGRRISMFQALRWYFAWRSSLRPGRSPVVDRVPWIVFGAKEFLAKQIKPGSKVFEYGMGGSTLFFLDAGCTVVSVEHNAEWGERLANIVRNNTRWTPLIVPPGQKKLEGSWGGYDSEFPGHEKSEFRAYVEAIAAQPDESLDVVMVDGRARNAALAVATTKVAVPGVIVLDNAERARYTPAVSQLIAQGWIPNRFFGAGPYVDYECWDTLILRRSSSVSFGKSKN